MRKQIHAPPSLLKSADPNEPDTSPKSETGDDRALVHSARANPLAFGRLYEAYRERVFWYLLARTGNTDDAADLTQQVFLKALDALSKYQPEKGPFVAWLFGIARHTVTNFAERGARAVAWEYLEPESVRQPQPDDLEKSVLHRESVAQLRRLCAALDPAKQELLALRFVAGLTSAEIGATIGKSEAAVKKQLTRILHRLREQYYDLSA